MADPKNPGPDIDTGTGGFKPTGVSDKRHTFDPGLGDSDDPIGKRPDWSPGQVSVDKSVKDLSPGTKRTLGAYLSQTTLGQTPSASVTKPNKYAIQQDVSKDPVSVSTTDVKGYVAPLTPYDAGSPQDHFSNFVPGDSRSPSSLSLNLTRGRMEITQGSVDGNDVLKDALPPQPGAPVPPPRGTVNSANDKLSEVVKTYTEAVLKAPGGGLTVGRLFSEGTHVPTPSTPYPSTPDDLTGYLGKATTGDLSSSPSPVDNAYPVDGSKSSAARITDEKGYPSPLTVVVDPQRKFSEISTGRSNVATVLNILRGRQEPIPSPDPTKDKTADGNRLLPGSMKPTGGANPPAPGTVNVGTLDGKSPVKFYTDAAVKGNEFGSESPFIGKSNATFLRPADKLDKEPFNGFGPNPQDESPSRKKTLTDYLGDITKSGYGDKQSKGNVFPIDTSTTQEGTLLDDGLPRAPNGTPNASKYIDDNVLKSRSSAAASIDARVSRGRSPDRTKVDGNYLIRPNQIPSELNPSSVGGKLPSLKTVPTTDIVPQIKDYYDGGGDLSKAMFVNRFSTDAPYSLARSQGGEKYASRYKYGSYDPADGNARNIDFGRLAQVGASLALASSTEINGHPGDNPTSGAADASSWLPGWGQLGVERVNRDDLNAGRFIEALGGVDAINEELITSPAGKSWGTLNNMHDKFSGITAMGMILLAVALLIAFTVIITLLTLLFMIPLGNKGGLTRTDAKGRYAYGAFEADAYGADYGSVAGMIRAAATGKFNLWRALGFPATHYSMSDTLSKGALSFFGIDTSGGVFSAIGSAVTSMSSQPGYYSIMGRAINRSFLVIGDAFADLGKAFSSGNIASGIMQLFGLFTTFQESKFMKACGIFMHIGDRVAAEDEVEEKSPGNKLDPDAIGNGRKFMGPIDKTSNGNTSVLKSRLNVQNDEVHPYTLAWSSYRSPDMFIAPASLNYAILQTPDNKRLLGTPSLLPKISSAPTIGPGSSGNYAGLKYGNVYVSVDGNRIPTNRREQLEDALESEYMPFYLHDVRTNEIVSFHAFLASLSDDYMASYDSADAFGRVEPIKVYKGTTRKIGFSFYIAATSPADFNSMWLKINKLTTMIYPQFSEGRKLTSPDGTASFEMPFSQVIQAAPFVRLRIGDLVKSNYSKFNLARLFGFGSPESKFDGITMPPSKDFNSVDQVKILQEALSPGKTFNALVPLNRHVPKSSLNPLSVPVKIKDNIDLPRGLVLSYVGTDSDIPGNHILEVTAASGDDLAELISTGFSDFDLLEVVNKYANGSSDENIVSEKFSFKPSEISPSASASKEAYKKAVESSSTKYTENVIQFMNDDPINGTATNGNAVARAFRSSGGKGLGGFIESMSFDWYDRVTWEIGEGTSNLGPLLGRRAPKMCKVTISFAPIHDIAPGLDRFGVNRAPIYPVGSHAFDDRRPKAG